MVDACFALSNLKNFQRNVLFYHRTGILQKEYSYLEIIRAVQSILDTFKTLNISRNSGFAFSLKEHTPASCVLFLAVLNYDGYICPLDANLNEEQMQNYLQRFNAKFIFADSVDKTDETAERVNLFGELFFLAKVDAVPSDIKQTLPIVIYKIGTSGSTGLPKTVHVTFDSIQPNIRELSKRLLITENDVIFLGTPLTFDPFFIEFFLALKNGAALLTTTAEIRLNPKKLLKVLHPMDSKLPGITVLQMTPSIFRLFGTDNIRNTILCTQSTLRVLILGGEQFPSTELSTWLHYPLKETNKRIVNIYGITELSCWSTMHVLTYDELNTLHKRECIPIGQPIDNETTIRLVDELGNPILGVGEGELLLGSATRHCYIPEIDGPALKTGMVFRSTGDIIRRDQEGEMIYVGRMAHTIKRLGKRINLDWLDKKLETLLCPGLKLAARFLWCQHTQRLVLYIFTEDQLSKRLDETRIRVMEFLEPHEKPDKIIYASNLPLNKHGKVDLSAIARTYEEENLKMNPYKYFKNFMSNVLGVELRISGSTAQCKKSKNSMAATFLELGGTSFQALSLATEIGNVLKDTTDQSQLLDMLLSGNYKINDVCEFLQKVKYNAMENGNPKLVLPTAERQIKLHLAWRVNMRKCVDASPALCARGYICIGSHANLMCTIDATSGETIAQMHLPKPIECQVEFVTSGLALVGNHDYNVYAFDYMTAEVLWKCNIGGLIKAKPLHINGIAIICSYAANNNVVGICLKNQFIAWRNHIGEKGICVSPIQVEENALICTLDGTYALISSKTGFIIWQNKCTTPIFSRPAFILGTLHFVMAEVSGHVHICSTLNGLKLKTVAVPGMIFSDITTTKATDKMHLIFFGCFDHNVYAMQYDECSEKSLNVLWKTNLQEKVYATPLIMASQNVNYLVACNTGGKMYILELRSGFLAGTYELFGEVYSSPCVGNNSSIYIGCRDNYFYCLQLD